MGGGRAAAGEPSQQPAAEDVDAALADTSEDLDLLSRDENNAWSQQAMMQAFFSQGHLPGWASESSRARIVKDNVKDNVVAGGGDPARLVLARSTLRRGREVALLALFDGAP